MPWMTQRLGDQVADAHARIERGEGVLEDHLDVAAHALQPVPVEAGDVDVPPSRMSPLNGTRPASALAVVDLPQPLSPTSDRVSPVAMVKLTPLDRMHAVGGAAEEAAAHVEADGQVARPRRRCLASTRRLARFRCGHAGAEARHGGQQLRAYSRCVGAREERADGAALDHAALPHDDDAVGHLGDDAHVVGDEDDAVPNSFLQVAQQFKDLACTVTSSAVVGSSAISTSGRSASAMAIITRWRMPPESSCGYCFSRVSACGMRTASSASMARFARRAARQRRCAPRSPRSAAGRCQHRVERGHRLLEDHGDAVAANAPHRALRRASPDPVPPNRIEPPANPRGRLRQQPHDGERGHRLARAGFAGDAQGLAAPRSKDRSSTSGASPASVPATTVEAVDGQHVFPGRAGRLVRHARDRCRRPALRSFEDAAREVERHDPVRHVDDLADPEVAADRDQHVGVDGVHVVARRPAGRSSG